MGKETQRPDKMRVPQMVCRRYKLIDMFVIDLNIDNNSLEGFLMLVDTLVEKYSGRKEDRTEQ